MIREGVRGTWRTVTWRDCTDNTLNETFSIPMEDFSFLTHLHWSPSSKSKDSSLTHRSFVKVLLLFCFLTMRDLFFVTLLWTRTGIPFAVPGIVVSDTGKKLGKIRKGTTMQETAATPMWKSWKQGWMDAIRACRSERPLYPELQSFCLNWHRTCRLAVTGVSLPSLSVGSIFGSTVGSASMWKSRSVVLFQNIHPSIALFQYALAIASSQCIPNQSFQCSHDRSSNRHFFQAQNEWSWHFWSWCQEKGTH